MTGFRHASRPPWASPIGLVLASALVLGAAGALVLGCARGGKPTNVLLITVDTLRPDRLGYAGGRNGVSPNIDALAREGVVFQKVHSQSGWTLPSMATILTGRYPRDHQAVDFNYGLNRDLPTLAGILKEHGYDTRGYVSHILLTPQYGMDRGFLHLDHSVLEKGDPHRISTSKELTELAVADLRSLRKPFFVWVHYFDPHFAYLAHEPWTSFGNTDSDRYDQEIAYTDQSIGALLDFFRKKKLLENTVVVFTADHGEEFGEHGGQYHETCYEEVLRVPLVILGPGLAPRVETASAEQVDLMPTILARLGIPAPAECPGRDLLGSAGPTHPIFVERDRPPGFRQRCIIDGPLKLVRIETRDVSLIPEESRTEYAEVHNVAAGTFLYNLSDDPGEHTNLYREDDPKCELLLARLAAQFTGRGNAPAANVVVDQETRERLRSLGYIR